MGKENVFEMSEKRLTQSQSVESIVIIANNRWEKYYFQVQLLLKNKFIFRIVSSKENL